MSFNIDQQNQRFVIKFKGNIIPPDHTGLIKSLHNKFGCYKHQVQCLATDATAISHCTKCEQSRTIKETPQFTFLTSKTKKLHI